MTDTEKPSGIGINHVSKAAKAVAKARNERRPKGTGWLKNGNPPGDLGAVKRCLAKSRKGTLCAAPAMPNGRCRMHGGMSTGPRTPEGRANSARANWKHGLYSAEAKAQARAFRQLLKECQELLSHPSGRKSNTP